MYTMERKRLQWEAIVYLYAPKEEALVPIDNNKAMRKNVRNLPNMEIANWIPTETKDMTEEEHQHNYPNKKGSWAATIRSPIQDENQRSNEEYYNNAEKWNEWSKWQQQQWDGPSF